MTDSTIKEITPSIANVPLHPPKPPTEHQLNLLYQQRKQWIREGKKEEVEQLDKFLAIHHLNPPSQEVFKKKQLFMEYWSNYLNDGPSEQQLKDGFVKIPGNEVLAIQKSLWVYQTILTIQALAKAIVDERIAFYLLEEENINPITKEEFNDSEEGKKMKEKLTALTKERLTLLSDKFKLIRHFFFEFHGVPQPDYTVVQDEITDEISEILLKPKSLVKEEEEEFHILRQNK